MTISLAITIIGTATVALMIWIAAYVVVEMVETIRTERF